MKGEDVMTIGERLGVSSTLAKATVAWCRNCTVYLPAEDIGSRCPLFDCGAKLVRRVGYICPQCGWFHRTVKGMKECEHSDGL